MARVRCSITNRFLPLLALVLALAGCAASLVYDRLDKLVGWYIEGLVTLDDGQQQQLSNTLRRNLDWHRQAELGRYDAFLQQLAATFADGATREELTAAAQRAEVYWRDIFEQAAPGYAALAATLSDAQVRELLGNMAREDEEEWQDYAGRTPDERRARWEKSLRRNVERFTGRLSEAQRTIVHQYAWNTRAVMPLWRENRRVWREALAAALATRDNSPQFAARMHQLIARPDDLWTPEYRQALREERMQLIDMLVAIDDSLSARQRAAVQQQLLSLAQEVRSLARSPG